MGRWEESIRKIIRDTGFEVWIAFVFHIALGSCEHGNEHFGSIKDDKFLD
jgi:hypothetical protein